MKMSEAMRKGARMGPQLFNEGSDDGGGSCAFSAMEYGIRGGARRFWMDMLPLPEEISTFTSLPQVCPVKNCRLPYHNGGIVMFFRPLCVGDVIVHLNNNHRWTRECIAGWIEATFEGGIPAKEVMEMIGEPVKTRELVMVRPNTRDFAEVKR